jgi:hypothetical protein
MDSCNAADENQAATWSNLCCLFDIRFIPVPALSKGLMMVTLRIVFALLFSGVMAMRSATAQEVPSLEDILAEQDKWLAQFASIRVRWRDWHRVDVMEYHPTVPRDATLENSPMYSQHEFCWADTGCLSHDTIHMTGGKPDSRNVYGIKGMTGWASDSEAGGKIDEWVHVKILQPDSSRPLSTNLSMNALMSLWNCKSGVWWVQRLRTTPGAAVKGMEDVDGHPCVLVEMSWAEQGTQSTEMFWFDASVNYLPRRRRIIGSIGEMKWDKVWTADRFREVSPGFHFQDHGFYHLDKIPLPGFEWQIESVEFNPDFPVNQFDPRVSAGSKVTDYPGGRAYLAGAKGLKTEPDPVSSPPIVNTGPAAVAIPQSNDWRWLTIVCLLILGCLLTFKWLRIGRSPRSA